ncbi:MAG: hypothetical protein ACLFSB_15690 [Chitinispirillaceae bacterium]
MNTGMGVAEETGSEHANKDTLAANPRICKEYISTLSTSLSPEAGQPGGKSLRVVLLDGTPGEKPPVRTSEP